MNQVIQVSCNNTPLRHRKIPTSSTNGTTKQNRKSQTSSHCCRRSAPARPREVNASPWKMKAHSGCTVGKPGQHRRLQLPPRGTRKERKRPVANGRPAPQSSAPSLAPRAPPPHAAPRLLGPCTPVAPNPPLQYAAARASEPRPAAARARAFKSPRSPRLPPCTHARQPCSAHVTRRGGSRA